MNGDGLVDRLSHENDQGDPGIWVANNNGNGGFDAPTLWFHSPNKEGQNMPGWNGVYGNTIYGYTRLIDMNGDGLLDLVQQENYETGEKGLWVGLNNGSGFDARTIWWDVGLTYSNMPFWQEESSGGSSYYINIKLQDINGDSLPDRIAHKNTQTSELGFWVAINNGNGFDPETKWFDSPNKYGPAMAEWRGVNGNNRYLYSTLMDMNGDGLADRVFHYNYDTDEPGLWVAFNNGSGFDAPNLWLDTPNDTTNMPYRIGPVGSSGLIVYRILMDMNGDNLPDRVFWDNGVWVMLNNGAGFETETLWYTSSQQWDNAPIWQGFSGSTTWTYSNLQDINGDGLPDRLTYENHQTQEDGLWASLNNGEGFDAPVKYWQTTNKGEANMPQWQTDQYIYNTLMDINGDGFLDRLAHYNYDTSEPSLWGAVNEGKLPLITSITNGHGATTSIEYAPLTDSSVYTKDTDAVYPIQDVQGPMYVVKSYQSDNGLGGVSQMDYHYEGLKVATNGRGFCGFREVIATNVETGIATTTFYRQDHPYKSMAFKKEVKLSDGTLINRTEDIWSTTNFAHGGYFPHVSQSIVEEFEIDGTLINTTTTDKTYDNFGNTTEITITQGDGHSQTTTNTYVNDTTNWFLGRLTRADVSKQATGQPVINRSSSFTYSPTTGLLTEETIEPDHPTLWSKKTYTHDGYGNILTSTVTAHNISARTQTTSYDARGQFVILSTNTLGHSESKLYDLRHGKVTSLTGPNGLTTAWEYDGFGRLVNEYRTDGTESRTLTLLADAQSPAGSVYFVRSDSSGASPSITYYDILDREIRREAVSFDGTKIFVDTQYNNRGEVVQTSDPYFEGDTSVWTVNQYDDIGRVTTVTSPGNRVSTSSYNGYTTTVTNPSNQNKHTRC